jgi:hypothetical protein
MPLPTKWTKATLTPRRSRRGPPEAGPSSTAASCAGLGEQALCLFEVVAVDADVTAATKKIVVAERTIKAIKPDATVAALDAKVGALEVEAVIAGADVVFGCLDRDLPRLR